MKDMTPFFADGSQTSFSSIFGREKSSDYQSEALETPHVRRQTDLFIPANQTSEIIQDQSTTNLAETINQLKLIEFSGCIHFSSEVFFSRAGLLIHKGNCVGAVYSNNFGKSEDQTEVALRMTLREAFDGTSIFTSYSLNQELITSYSSLFLGQAMVVDEISHGPRYLEYLMESMNENKVTGTLVVAQVETNDLCFILYSQGCFVGFFMLYEKRFYDNFQSLTQYISQFTIAKVKASIISDDLCLAPNNYGYDLRDYLSGQKELFQ